MKSYPIGTGSLLSSTIAVLLGQGTIAAAQEDAKMTEAEAKMFTASAGYERFMGRWSRLMAPEYLKFADVGNGDRVLDVGTGTGSVDAGDRGRHAERARSSASIRRRRSSRHAQKNARSGRARFEVGDGQALKFKDASFDRTMALLVDELHPGPQQGNRRDAQGHPTRRASSAPACGTTTPACRCSGSSGTRPSRSIRRSSRRTSAT